LVLAMLTLGVSLSGLGGERWWSAADC
jgi:hypothetical protein